MRTDAPLVRSGRALACHVDESSVDDVNDTVHAGQVHEVVGDEQGGGVQLVGEAEDEVDALALPAGELFDEEPQGSLMPPVDVRPGAPVGPIRGCLPLDPQIIAPAGYRDDESRSNWRGRSGPHRRFGPSTSGSSPSPTGAECPTTFPSESTTFARAYCTPVSGRSRVSCSRVLAAQAVKSSSS